VPVGGFTTRELREHGKRVRFMVEAIDGPSALIARVGWTSGPRVGRYRVDVAAFEAVALPALGGLGSWAA
jgi:nucleoside-triphosphatase